MVATLWSRGLDELKRLTPMRARTHSQTRTPRGDSPWQSAHCVTKPHGYAFPDSESGIRLAEWNAGIRRRWLCVCLIASPCLFVSAHKRGLWDLCQLKVCGKEHSAVAAFLLDHVNVL